MKTAIVFLSLFGAACTSVVGQDDVLMSRIERRVSLPSGAAPLGEYRRYYMPAEDNSRLIRATYIHGGRPNRLWVTSDEFPIVLDGGCSVITFEFDVARGKAMDIHCNGGRSAF
jgi:hypothetical protein